MKQLAPADIPDYIRGIYKKNPFMSDFFHISLDEIHCGGATVSMVTDPAKHANHRGIIHGGVMAALADSVLGVTGASIGAVVVTVSMTVDYIRNTSLGGRIRVTSRIRHAGRTTIVIDMSMFDEKDRLLMDAMATMMVVDHFPEIPAKW